MAYNYEYPYFVSGQFNVDWLLTTVKKIEEELSGTKTYDYKGENEVLDLNDLRPNSMASFTENFNVLNAPISGSRRFVFTNGSETGGFQRCYNLKTMEVYSRNFNITNSSVIWGSWTKTQLNPSVVMNSIEFISNTSLDDNKPNTVSWVQGGNASVTNAPTGYNGFVLDWKSEGASPRIQVWFDMSTKFIYIRTFSSGNWSVWQESNHIDFFPYLRYNGWAAIDDANSWNKNTTVYAHHTEVNNFPVSGNGMFFSFFKSNSIGYQIFTPFLSARDFYARYYQNNTWQPWFKITANSTRTLIAASIPEVKEDSGASDNMYSEIARITQSIYLYCNGQSLFHSEPDAQSYTEAILARDDLQSFDSIITNLEQWDMDIPLDELLDKTRAFVEQIQSVTPITDIIILSVPPIDVPFLGEELYSYTWPSGNTLTEVDDALTAFAQELGFSYITWKDCKHINHTNLLTFYDNLYEEPVYKRSLETYVSRQVKNYIE